MDGAGATAWLESPDGTVALPININARNPGIHGNTGFLFRYSP